jgi:hypothetical protein
MTPTLTVPDPAVFPEDVRAFAAERGVTDYLGPLYELTKRCFDGADVRVVHECDPEIAGLQWIVFEVQASDWDLERYGSAHQHWLTGFHQMCPAAARGAFVLGER